MHSCIHVIRRAFNKYAVFKMFFVHAEAKSWRFQIAKCSVLASEGLVWTVGLTVEIKLCFRDGLVWTVSLTVEIKLRFRNGLVWTIDLTSEKKLRYRDGLF